MIQVVATDLDQPDHDNSDIRYRIMSQNPELPSDVFVINPVTGAISLNAAGLDREVCLFFLLSIPLDLGCFYTPV